MSETAISRKTYDIALTGMMAALVFLGTYFFKIPIPFGYAHLGDCMIVLTACLLGTRRGVLAGAVGAGLSDLLGGYAIWVLPTMVCKAAWVLIIGLFAYKLLPRVKYAWLAGAIVGGVIHVLLYSLVDVFFYGPAAALADIPGNITQTACGIIIGSVLFLILKQVPAVQKLTQAHN